MILKCDIFCREGTHVWVEVATNCNLAVKVYMTLMNGGIQLTVTVTVTFTVTVTLTITFTVTMYHTRHVAWTNQTLPRGMVQPNIVTRNSILPPSHAHTKNSTCSGHVVKGTVYGLGRRPRHVCQGT